MASAAPQIELPPEGPVAVALPDEVAGFAFALDEVASKSNARRYRRGAADSSSDSRQQAFQDDVAVAARRFKPAWWQIGSPERAPAERPQVVCVVLARATIDAANLPKSVTDAVQGVLVHNDATVRAVLCTSLPRRTRRWCLVGFAQRPAGTGAVELTRAAGLLGDAVAAVAADAGALE